MDGLKLTPNAARCGRLSFVHLRVNAVSLRQIVIASRPLLFLSDVCPAFYWHNHQSQHIQRCWKGSDHQQFRLHQEYKTKVILIMHCGYSHDPLQLSMIYLLLSSVLRMIRDHLEPTATLALDKMSPQKLRDGLTTKTADRCVGSTAPRVMENQQYRTPLLNTMIRKADLSDTSSFSEAQVIEVSSVA